MSKVENRIYFENLDGLRFIAVVSVFLFHSFHTNFEHIRTDSIYKIFKGNVVANGDLGVNFFFVLSGFLITYLLLAEKQSTGKIHLLAFYIRRILRIWPLYFVCVLFGFVFFPMIKALFGYMPTETAEIIYFLLFLSNFNNIYNGLPDASILGVLWSVSIEEQFYLIWPIFFFFTNSRTFPAIPISLILVSIIFRIYNPEVIYFHTLSVMSDLCIGALGAYFAYTKNQFVGFITSLSKTTITIGYLVGLTVIVFRNQLFFGSAYFLERIVYSMFFIFIILEQNYCKNSLFKVGDFKMLSAGGKYTYGFYCLHFIGILIATTIGNLLGTNNTLFGVLFLETFLAFVISFLLSFLSYHYFESVFLKLKRRFSI